jgi:hypothetical protein
LPSSSSTASSSALLARERAAYGQFNFPYLYDGENQKVSHAYGPAATPHLFIFVAQRKLRHQGRVDNNPCEALVTRRDVCRRPLEEKRNTRFGDCADMGRSGASPLHGQIWKDA